MKKISIDDLLKKPVSWLVNNDQNEDIAISSRIRLARNIADVKFPIHASDLEKAEILSTVTKAVLSTETEQKFNNFDLPLLSKLERQVLLERHLISREFCSGKSNTSLLVNDNESLGIMINEEDHLRLQSLQPGLSLWSVWEKIDSFDSKLNKLLPFAFDKVLGYLTSCPTNVGTGLRASVMLNLPGLTLSGNIEGVIRGLGKLGLAVRGLFGEGSSATGNLFQISNQSTLGESEIQIIQHLNDIIEQIILHEVNARQNLIEKKREFLLDCVGRAYGILRYSYILSSDEALKSLSILRMGIDMNMFQSIDKNVINDLFIAIQSAHLQKIAGYDLNVEQRDILRAEIIRNKFNKN